MVARHGKMNTFMVAAFTIAASAAVAAVNATKTLTLPGGATMELIYVSPGTFMMGSPSSEAGRFDDEMQHQVTLTKGSARRGAGTPRPPRATRRRLWCSRRRVW